MLKEACIFTLKHRELGIDALEVFIYTVFWQPGRFSPDLLGGIRNDRQNGSVCGVLRG